MNNKFAALSKYLHIYPEEYRQYIDIVNSYYFPILLKIAQQQLPLFENIETEDQAVSNKKYEDNFSFKSTSLGDKEARALDLILDKLKAAYPNKSNDELIDQLKNDFINSPVERGPDSYDPSEEYSIFSRRPATTKRYLSLFPDLKYNPEFKQLSLPFEGSFNPNPLGESPTSAQKREERDRENYDLLLSDEEAKTILNDIRAKSPESFTYQTRNKLNTILKTKILENNDEPRFSDLEKVLNLHFNINSNPSYFKADIDDIKQEIENKWNELFSLFNKVKLLKKELDPGDFTPKSVSEIKDFKDSILSTSQYSSFIIKKISLRNINITPFKNLGRSHRESDNLSEDLESIKQSLEQLTLDPNPKIDGKRKLKILDEEILNHKNSIENFKKYKNFFKKLDKDLENECIQKIANINPEELKVINWISKYRIDLIRDAYLDSLKSFACNIESEAKKYTYSEQDTSVKYIDIFGSLYSRSTPQKDFIKSITITLMEQRETILQYIQDYVSSKILASLFEKCRETFNQKYFEYPLYNPDYMNNNSNFDSYSLKIKNSYINFESIKSFIQDYNGKPNLKSFINVMANNIKDPTIVDRYLKTMIGNEPFEGTSLETIRSKATNINAFKQTIFQFIGKTKIKTEDELIAFATESLSNDFFELMKKVIAEFLFDKLKSNYNFRASYYDASLHIDNELLEPLAPTLTTKAFNDWLNLGFAGRDGPKTVNGILARLSNRLSSVYLDIESRNSHLFSGNDKYQDIYDAISEIRQKQRSEEEKTTKQDRYDLVDNILNLMSPVFSEFSGQLQVPDPFYQSYGPALPILEGGIVYFMNGEYKGETAKIISRPSYHEVVFEINGKTEKYKYDNIYKFLRLSSPSKEDFFSAISSLKKKKNINNFNVKNNSGAVETKNIKDLLDELGLPWTVVYNDLAETPRFQEICELYNKRLFDPNNLIQTIRTVTQELRVVDSIASFNKNTQLVAEAFGGIGFKDISAGIENIFSRNKIEGVSKKEFISKISSFVNNSFNQIDSSNDLYLNSFLTLLKDNRGSLDNLISPIIKKLNLSSFDNLISPIIKKLNLKDFQIINQVCYQVNHSSKNFAKEDVVRALGVLRLEGMDVTPAVEKIINAASFIHNNSTLPPKYTRFVINSPNFYSDSKISKEYLDSCTTLFKQGGVDGLSDPNSNISNVIQKMVISGLIPDVETFKNELISFSKLCMKRDGIRSNLGNPTAELKLNYLVKKIIDKENQGFNIDFSNYFPTWSDLTFEDRVAKIKEYVQTQFLNGENDSGTTIGMLNDSITDGSFDREVEIIRQTASTKAQYFKDLKIKQIIQKANSNLKMLEMSSNLITYAKDAKKKDQRLFNFEYSDPQNNFRFRVLRNLDPYHFSVGADTNCCQRVGGYGHNAAVDSFINPLAGVLLLEINNDGAWATASQSYFHYVPKNNGVILDNVEYNSTNCFNFFNNKEYDINMLYAAFADYLKNKYNLSYFRCGERYNKLNNARFNNGKIVGGDPRHFEYKKYSDFTASDHIDLLKPKFKITTKFEI